MKILGGSLGSVWCMICEMDFMLSVLTCFFTKMRDVPSGERFGLDTSVRWLTCLGKMGDGMEISEKIFLFGLPSASYLFSTADCEKSRRRALSP